MAGIFRLARAGQGSISHAGTEAIPGHVRQADPADGPQQGRGDANSSLGSPSTYRKELEMSKVKRTPLIFGDVALVPLTRGQWATIDVYDLDAISTWCWHAARSGPNATWYARRGSDNRGLHNAIMGPGLFDHIDGDGLNNRRVNLRPASLRQNVHNSRMPTTNTSGFKGVFKPKGRQRWDARIQPTVRPGKNRTIYLGSFLDK